MYKEKKSKAKKAVAMAKGRAYEDLYARLEIKEGEKELYRLARQRDRAEKCNILVILMWQHATHNLYFLVTITD